MSGGSLLRPPAGVRSQLPVGESLRLAAYDMLCGEAAVAVNERNPAESHEVR